jgi:glycosyltransferase involved in cell wall biosynthesis
LSFSDFQAQRREVPLRVGYVLKRFPRLTETFILNEMLELERHGAIVEVFSLREPRDEPRHPDLARLNATIHYLTSSLPADPCGEDAFEALWRGKPVEKARKLRRQAARISGIAASAGLDHLHAHFASDAATAALIAGELSGVPVSFTAHARDIYHTYVSPEVDDAVRRAKLEMAGFVVTVSDYNARYLHELSGGRARIQRIYNGIDTTTFEPDAGIARERDLILSVGRLVEKKGLDDLVTACARLRDQDVAFRCRIVGEGPLRGALEARIETLGLAAHVRLLGALPQHEVRAMMHRARLMVLPCVVSSSGDRDGLPTVLLESLAVGLPAVSTSVSGVPEIIDDGTTGLLVEPSDCEGLASAMRRLLDDDGLAGALSRAGRRKALAAFDLSTNVNVLKNLMHTHAGIGAGLNDNRGTVHAHRLSIG